MKHLKGKKGISPDVILNLRRISIGGQDSVSSSTCSNPAFFHFECETKDGYVEDPDMSGEITVLNVEKQKNFYVLKVRFKREASE